MLSTTPEVAAPIAPLPKVILVPSPHSFAGWGLSKKFVEILKTDEILLPADLALTWRRDILRIDGVSDRDMGLLEAGMMATGCVFAVPYRKTPFDKFTDEQALKLPLSSCGFPVGHHLCQKLWSHGITTVGELCKVSWAELQEMEIGVLSCRTLRSCCETFGFRLKDAL